MHHLRGKSLTNEANTSLCYQSRIIPEDEPYYPVNDDKNGKLYAEYKKLAEQEENVIFGGRLGEYKYYDMAPIIKKVMNYTWKIGL